MQKIVPNLWFDTQAKAAVDFYISLFPNSHLINTTTLHNTPSGDADIVSFNLNGYQFMAISAGPDFKLNPSISFMVNFDPSIDEQAEKNLNDLWGKLIVGGKALMPLDSYPFSKRYGWLQDKYGLTWQLILTDPTGEPRPFIIPHLLFVGDVCGKTKEATDFYRGIFKNSKQGNIAYYPKGMEPDKEGTIMFSDFNLDGQWFNAMDSAHTHDFSFNEAVSFMVKCINQEEIDYYWEKLSAVPEVEACGWLKDKFGVSWQIVPVEMDEMINAGSREQIDRLTQALLTMKKYDIAAIKKAYDAK